MRPSLGAHHGFDAELVAHVPEKDGEAYALEGEHRRGEEDVFGVEGSVHGQEQQRGEQYALHGGEAYEHEDASRPEHDEVGDEQQQNDELEERGHRLPNQGQNENKGGDGAGETDERGHDVHAQARHDGFDDAHGARGKEESEQGERACAPRRA